MKVARYLVTWLCLSAAVIVSGGRPIAQESPPDNPPPDPATSSAPADPSPQDPSQDSVAATSSTETSSRHREREIVRVGSDVVVGRGEEASVLVVVLASATMEGKIEGNMVVVCGEAKVDGEVGGNLVVPAGSLELGPRAHIRGNVVVVGGALTADPKAIIEGHRQEVTWAMLEEKLPFLAGIKAWLLKGLLLARPLPHQAGWWWGLAAIVAVVYLLGGLLFGRPIAAGVSAIEDQPVASFFVGILGYILFSLLFLLLAATGIGLLIIPFLLCGAVVAFVFGKVAVFTAIGRQLGLQTGISLIQKPLAALLVGMVVTCVLYMVPVLGFLFWGLTATLGLGAVLVAFAGALRQERPNHASVGLAVTPSQVMANPVAGAAAPVQPPVIEDYQTQSASGALALPRAGFWIRFGATLIDFLIMVAILTILGLMPFFLIPWTIYHIGLWGWKGTTIGGAVCGVKLLQRDGQTLDFGKAAIRYLASCLSALVFFLGFFWVGWTREKTAWHDSIAGTVAVKVPRGTALL